MKNESEQELVHYRATILNYWLLCDVLFLNKVTSQQMSVFKFAISCIINSLIKLIFTWVSTDLIYASLF